MRRVCSLCKRQVCMAPTIFRWTFSGNIMPCCSLWYVAYPTEIHWTSMNRASRHGLAIWDTCYFANDFAFLVINSSSCCSCEWMHLKALLDPVPSHRKHSCLDSSPWLTAINLPELCICVWESLGGEGGGSHLAGHMDGGLQQSLHLI